MIFQLFIFKLVSGGLRSGGRQASGGRDVVPHCPQTLVSSFRDTTSFRLDGPSPAETWCSTACKPLFLRPEAPRLSDWMGFRRQRRGAPPPAKPCFFVRKHHVFRFGWAFAGREWCSTACKPLFLMCYPSIGQ